MRKLFFTTLATLICFAACEKDVRVQDETTPIDETPVKEQVTITASIPEEGLATKVAFEEEDSGGGKMRLTKLLWEEGDELTINGETFTVKTGTISLDGKTADFTGNDPGAGPYTITYSSLPGDINNQTQKADGDPDYLGYSVSLTGATTYTSFEFSDSGATALGATLTQSSVLQLRAVLPAAVASVVRKVIFTSSKADLFGSSNTLSVELETPGTAGSDNTLDIYAALPAGADVTLDANMDLLIQFQVSANAYDKYTAYRQFTSGTHFIIPGRNQYIGINCANIESYANKSNTNIGESTNPYRIGDQHQMQWLTTNMSSGTTYITLVDDIDMTGVTWTLFNNTGSYDKLVAFDGNDKTISNLGYSLFYVFKGSISDLTLDHSSITQRGIFAEYCQGTGNSITNVDVTNGTINSTSNNVGSLIGAINIGSDITGSTVATITGCDVSATNVTGAGVVGGVIGFANELVIMNGCTYTDGTVTTSARFAGGMLGSTGNYNSVISDCHVENATISATVSNNDFRAGGFIGQQQTNVQIKGCSVGKSGENVTISLAVPTSGKAYNSGGFAGVAYGTITKNGVVRSSAYATITAANTTTSAELNLGGFAGYNTGTIEYSDATVTMTGLEGARIGGFVGYLSTATGKVDNCSLTGAVTGNNYSGGLIGYADSDTPTITNNIVSGTLNAQSSIGGIVGYCNTGNVSGNNSSMTVSGGTNVGGIAGYASNTSTFVSNSTSGNVTGTGGAVGGIVGGSNGAITISKCSSSGSITGVNGTGGILGSSDNSYAVSVSNCYSTGSISGGQATGGIVGELGSTGTVTNCYSTSPISGPRVLGGVVGRACSKAWSETAESNNTISGCIAWNPSIICSESGAATIKGGSGTIVGYTSFKNILSSGRRYYNIDFQPSDSDYKGTGVDQPDCDGTNWVKGTTAGTGKTYQCPYHGTAAASDATVKTVAVALGWSSSIWDFSTDLPTLTIVR